MVLVCLSLCVSQFGAQMGQAPGCVSHNPTKGLPFFHYQLLSLHALNPPIIPLKCQRYFQTQRRITFPHVDAAKPSLETEVAVVSGDFSH